MKIGFVAGYTEERVKFAREAGFDCLELYFDAKVLDLARAKADDLKRVRDVLSAHELEAASLGCSPNHLDPDSAKRRENNQLFRRAIEIVRALGTDVVATNAWGDKTKGLEGNLPVYKEVFSEYARMAEANGVRIALENCPHAWGYPWMAENFGHSPQAFTAMFDAVPSKAIGLEWDPSHYVWLGIDYIRAIREFPDRIYLVHAKDTEILRDQLARGGFLSQGWWRYRIPGWGEVNWKDVFMALADVGYRGPILIEHEDPVFEGARRDEGLRLGLKFLSQFRA